MELPLPRGIALSVAPDRLTFAAGLIALGLVGLAFQGPLTGLQRVELGTGAAVLSALGWMTLGLTVALKGRFWTLAALWPAGWMAALIFAPGASSADPTLWVCIFQLAAIAATVVLVNAGHALSRSVAVVAAGLMLIVFGVVHLLYVDAIAGMIPEGFPGRTAWPWFTGAACVAAGLSLVSGVLAAWAAAATGLMFASWIALVHLPRLAQTPGDRAEWTGLAMAVTLVGVMWILHTSLRANPVRLGARRDAV